MVFCKHLEAFYYNNIQLYLLIVGLIHCLSLLLCVPYIIACNVVANLQCAPLRCAAISIQAIITTFVVFRRVLVTCATLLQRDLFLFLWCSVCLFRTAAPPPQTKTLKTKRVFLYRVRFVFQWQAGKVIENFLASLSFHI